MKYFSNKSLDDKIKKGGGGGGETYTADEDTLHLGDGNEFSISDSWKGKINLGVMAYGKIYFQPNANLSSLVEPIAAFDYLGSKKGLIFESVAESDVESSPAHLMLRNFGTVENPNYALYTPYAIISKGDQIVGSGTPGGGGGGDSRYLNDLLDVTITNPSNGQALVYQNGEWVNGSAIPDLSNYYTKTQTDTAISSAITALNLGAAATYGVATSISSSSDNLHLATGKAVYDYVALAVTSALKYRGITTTDIKNNPTQNPIIIGGDSYSAVSGDVVLMSGSSKEYLWNGTSWQELGDESSYVLKTQTINGYSLSDNITLGISDIIGGASVGSVSKPIYYTGSSFAEITDLNLLNEAAGRGYAKAKRFVLFSQGNTEVYFEWVPGENGNPGYVQLNSAFLTQGDQIVGSGTPGGSDPGGAHYLKDLLDVSLPDDTQQIGDGQVLMWDATNQVWKNGTVQSSGGTVTQINVGSSPYTPDDSGVVSLPAYPTIPSTYAWTSITDRPTDLGDFSNNAGYLLASDAVSTYQPIIPANTYAPYSTVGAVSTLQGYFTNGVANTAAKLSTVSKTLWGVTYWTSGGVPTNVTGRPSLYLGTTQIQASSAVQAVTGVTNLTMSGKLTIGSAEIEWVVGTGGAPGYLKINSALLTDGDQIVGSGTPGGGGGGGGASYLYELKDFQSGQSKATDTGTMLMYQATGITDVNGNTGAWKYASPSDVASAIGLSGYVTLAGTETITGVKTFTNLVTINTGGWGGQLEIKRGTSTGDALIKFSNAGDGVLGYLGIRGSGSNKVPAYTADGTNIYTLYHSGNLSLATLAGSTGVGSIAQPVYYTGSSFALVQATFGNASYGEHDADNIASNGLWYYNSNGPATSLGASTTDGALYSQAYSTSWVGQIAQDYRNGHLYVRGKNNGTWQSWLKVWDSGNSNSTSVNWSASTLTANYAHLGNGNSITNLELFGSATGSAIGFYKSGTRVALLYSNGDAPFQRYSGDWTIGYTIYDSGNSNKSDVPWTCSTLTSSVATGTAPLTVASTTMVDNLNANYLGGYALDDVVPHSAYSYGNGYLVKTGFSADATRHYLITIEGSAYNYSPIFSQAEVYTNQTTSTNTAFAYAYVVHYGRMKINNLQAFFYGGLLYIWFQQPRTYCAVKVKVQYHNASANYVTAISNEAIPSSGVTCLTSFTEYQGAFTDSNVASATKLQTERTIWGQSFDGTGNVNGLITVSGIGGAAITQEKGANTVFRLGSGSSATTAGTEYGILSLFQNGTEMVRLYANSSNPSWINAGSFGVGTASPGAKFHVYGTSGASITPMSVFEHTGDYEWNCPSTFLAPNVTAGHNVSFGIGKAASTKNQGSLQFYYAGSSSNSNLFGLGLYGVDYALTVSGGGNVGIGLGTTAAIYTLHVAGASAALINSSGPVYQLISAGTNGWSYIRLSSGASSDTVWDLATTNSTSSAIAQVGAFEIRDGKDSAAGISIRHASSDYGKLVVRVNSGQSSIGYWSTSNNLVSGYPIWTVGYTADTGDTFGWYCKSSTPGWKMNLSPNGDLTNTGSIYTNRIFLSRSTNNAYGRIGFYSSSYYTWYFYMGPTGSGYPCPTGAATPSGSVVTSWALRSLIENASGYGWTWESCSNGHNQTPVIQMELSSNTGVLRTRGDQVISSDINLKTNLQDVTYSVEDIAKTRAVTFDWKDGRGKSAGSIAQDWKPLIPELVHGDEGNMTLAYGQIALVNSILLAKHETEQDKEIKRLKARVRALEKQLKMRS